MIFKKFRERCCKKKTLEGAASQDLLRNVADSKMLDGLPESNKCIKQQ